MSVKLFAMTCGWLTMPAKMILEGMPGALRLPIPAYLIVHPKGKAIFDSGLHSSLQNDPAERLGGLARVTTVEYQPGEELSARLAAMDIDTRDINYLINSHLHFDHAGGNDQIPNAPLLIQRPEWEAAHDPDLAAANSYDLRDFDLGQDVRQVDGEFDVFGDGTVVIFPTYGHTPGHQSLKVRLDSGDIILTGDACYMRKTLEDLHLPRILHDRDAMIATLQSFRALERRGARIFYGHDAEHWANVPQAPLPVV
ncbi:MAG TPA: MBL fold metallo-hydrolase [Alphaproteobacteria bacterium]|jgi:glyoxylase-like metal-dependent hydrolase (beta-lactamase superfamily II)|nr:MBL fold metallo-hydrolase [Alphaproteobacteria bacterium]HAM47171.1 MBL fold metallo-hydrolase [Alphaproteobacteria bacterium]HBA42952.1 MBL fold metallo-hydrolase [Alphaproteobacteria bacterium]HBC54231.1 MBL fold metallo-hydrolase [Alphaproteobacteria bacterium]HBF99855.1 MBL fold metallo-hydrolase [Alphaproteobacteria bacterium]